MSSTAPVKSNGSAVEDCPRDWPNTEPITGLKAGVQMLFSICVLCSMLSSCFYRQPTVASSSLIAQRACKLADGFLRLPSGNRSEERRVGKECRTRWERDE